MTAQPQHAEDWRAGRGIVITGAWTKWYASETAAATSAAVLRSVHQLDASTVPLIWMLYTEGARRLGFAGPVPVPLVSGTARQATA